MHKTNGLCKTAYLSYSVNVIVVKGDFCHLSFPLIVFYNETQI